MQYDTGKRYRDFQFLRRDWRGVFVAILRSAMQRPPAASQRFGDVRVHINFIVGAHQIVVDHARTRLLLVCAIIANPPNAVSHLVMGFSVFGLGFVIKSCSDRPGSLSSTQLDSHERPRQYGRSEHPHEGRETIGIPV